jgi:hypothetical protein
MREFGQHDAIAGSAAATAPIAGLDKLGELLLKAVQFIELASDRRQTIRRNIAHRRAILVRTGRQSRKHSHLADPKPQIAAAADEGQPIYVGTCVVPMPCCATSGRGDETDLLVIADRRRRGAAGLGRLADRNDGILVRHREIPLALQVT